MDGDGQWTGGAGSRAARDGAIAAALELFKVGRPRDAAAALRDVLLRWPGDPDALHYLGVALDASGDAAGGERAIGAALDAGETASRRCNHGMVLGHLGRHAEAVASLERALALRPTYPEALNNLGASLAALRRGGEAEVAYRRALALRPAYAEAWNNLGNALRARGAGAEAIDAFARAAALDPAAESPALAPALAALGCFGEAVAAGRRAVARNPEDAGAHLALGDALRNLGDAAGAEAATRRAIALRPGGAEGYNNLAVLLQGQGRLAEALAVLDLALALAPDDPETHHHRALVLFLQGRMGEAWDEYEWRMRITQAGDSHLSYAGSTPWRGEPVEGRTVLVVPEQGLGDMIQFVRYVPMLAERGARVLLAVHPPLRRLFAAVPGVERLLVASDPMPEHDAFCPLLSLPRSFCTTPDTVPAPVPYLRAEPALAAAWRERLAGPGLKVGLVWAGNPLQLNDRRRSIPFAALSPLWAVPGVRWFGLQVGPRAADLAGAPEGVVTDLSPELADFADTAAAMEALDLVVSVCTSPAHLAGALGRPVWTLLAAEGDWRWGVAGADTPWYPTMRLFRCRHDEGWGPTVERVAAALRAMASPSIRTAPARRGRPAEVLFGWGVASTFGWGVYGLNLLLAWAGRDDLRPTCIAPHRPEDIDVDPLERALLMPALDRSAAFAQRLVPAAGRRATTPNLVLHALNNGLERGRTVHDVDLHGEPTLAVAFLDRTDLPADAAATLASYPLVVAGSAWNATLLRDAGAPQVERVLQGVDASHFHPGPRRGLLGDRFVVFSGGKLEHRKAQDLVLRAFRTFARHHSDAVLLTAWSSPWPALGRELAAASDLEPPTFADGVVDVPAWCEANGVPRDCVRALGLVPNRALPRILREADVALFPNRAEGGTNLVAMECMACGVPTILSANTGHLDLLEMDAAMPLLQQRPIAGAACQGWGESNVDEIVAALERVYLDRALARERGTAGARAMSGLTWVTQMDQLLSLVKPYAT